MISEDIRRWLEKPPAQRGMRLIEDMFVIGTDIGKSREENQDRVAVLKIGSSQRNRTSWCACVSDGMGGMKDGSQAASLALAAFFSSLISNRRLDPKVRLQTAAQEANDQVAKNVVGGGATISAILLEEDAIFTLNVGDSRIYHLAPEADIRRLTVDDTLAEAFGAEDRGLLQYIGSKARITPHVKQLEPLLGTLIVTSDGAHVVGDYLLNELSQHAVDATEYCSHVLDLANWMGGRDNATLIATLPLPPAAFRNMETSSDVSVWTVEGRLKITWASGRSESAASERSTKQSTSENDVRASVLEPVHPAINRNSKQSGEAPNTNARKRKPGKSKKQQIEIGFSDEGAEPKDGNS